MKSSLIVVTLLVVFLVAAPGQQRPTVKLSQSKRVETFAPYSKTPANNLTARPLPDSRPSGSVSGQDPKRAAAEKLLAEAEELGTENTAAARMRALEKLSEALSIWQAAGDTQGEARTLNSMAEIFHVDGDSKRALEACERALQLFQNLGDRAGKAKTLNDIGGINWDNGEAMKALGYFNQSLEIWQQTGDLKQQAEALNNIGMAHDDLGESRPAMEYLDRSLVLRRAIGDQLGEGTTLSNIGSVHDSLGELTAALDYYTQALPLFRAAKNLRREALTLNNIGYAWSNLGEIQKALEYYTAALPIRRAVGDRRGEAISLSNLGSTYNKLGENERALEEFNESLALFRSLADQAGEARTLNNIANVYLQTDETQRALEILNQILEVRRAKKDKRAEGSTLGDLGFAHYQLKNYTVALEYLRQSLAIARAVESRSDEAGTLRKLGAVWAAMGQLERSAEAYGQALQIYREIGSHEREAMTLYGSANTELRRGNLDVARKQISAAIELAESLRGKFTSEELRVSLLAEKQKHYETYVDVLMRLHEREPGGDYDAMALQIHEQARARGLIDLLNETHADIRQGGDPALLARERALQQQLNEKERYRMSLLRSKEKEGQLAAVEKELNGLLSEFEETEAGIRAKSPQYAALTQPKPLDLREIQTKVLDPETVLLEYALGDERSYLWFVTPSSRATFVLPGRAEINQQARRFYQLLSAKMQAASARAQEPTPNSASPAETDYRDAAIILGKTLLGPVAGRLGRKRLLVVSDGALQYVPFAALHKALGPDQKPGDSRTAVVSAINYRPLILDHEVVNMPSASALSYLRNDSSGRRKPTKTIAVLADPVFRSDDPRLLRSPDGNEKPGHSLPVAAGADTVGALERSSRDSGSTGFPRLRFSREEAEGIASLLPKEEALLALDFAASLTTAQNPDLERYRILHFATHGFLNSKHPELSGLVFSLVDEKGLPQDGFLRFHQIYNLKLSADLVVLSGCQTALGKEIRGEGLMGLTRGFMYAGAPRVVASLWSVEDRATAELMKRFYKAMLSDGLAPAAALRAAQIDLQAQRGWEAPYYWAGFTLQGDWK